MEEEEISDRDLAVIARDHLTQWEKLHPFLGLNRAQKKEIANSYPRDYGKQKRECLEVWKEERGREATYRVLISAAEEASDHQLADNIRDMGESLNLYLHSFNIHSCSSTVSIRFRSYIGTY